MLNKLVKFLILFLVFGMPVIFIPGLRDSFALPKVGLLRVIAMFLFPFVVINIKKIKLSRLNILAGIYIFIRILATILSINPALSWSGRYLFYFEGTFQLVCYFIFYLSVQIILREDNEFEKKIYHVIGCTSFIVCLYGVIQYLGLDFMKWDIGRTRVFSTIGNPTFLAGWLVLSLPLLLKNLLEVESTGKKWFSGIVLLLSFLVLMLTFSRAGWVGILGSIVILVFSSSLRRKLLPFFSVSIVITILFILFGGRLWNPDAPGIRSRFIGWQAGWLLIKERPLIGYGPDTFADLSVRLLPDEYSELTKMIANPGYAHNIFIDIAVSSGILGLIVFCLLILEIYCNRRSYNHSFLVASITGGLIYGFFSIATLSFWLYFWLYLGIINQEVKNGTTD